MTLQVGLYSLVLSLTVTMKKVDMCDVTVLLKSLEKNKHKNLILKCCEWGPGLGSTSQCQPSAFEKAKTIPSHSTENIAVDY